MFKNYQNYEVYEDGRIWSYKSNKFLKPQTNNKGYQLVQLTDNDGKPKTYQVHRVVWEAVTGEPIPKGYEINHRSEVKTENFFANLELVTHKENINWGTCIERRAKAHSKAMTNNPKISKQVGAFKNNELVMTFQSTNEARRNGFSQSAVAACCRNCFNREGNNVYKGYEWKYI
jgi:hypothetical protein